MPAVIAGPRSHVDDVVGSAHRLLVVFDGDHRVAEIAQPQQGVDEPTVVALVQADTGLVEDVEDPDQRRSDLRRQADTLGLASGECRRGALQREVADADIVEKGQALDDLPDDAVADHALCLGERKHTQRAERVTHAHQRELVDVVIANRDGETGGLQASALAVPARTLRHVLLDLLAHHLRLRLHIPALEVGDRSP